MPKMGEVPPPAIFRGWLSNCLCLGLCAEMGQSNVACFDRKGRGQLHGRIVVFRHSQADVVLPFRHIREADLQRFLCIRVNLRDGGFRLRKSAGRIADTDSATCDANFGFLAQCVAVLHPHRAVHRFRLFQRAAWAWPWAVPAWVTVPVLVKEPPVRRYRALVLLRLQEYSSHPIGDSNLAAGLLLCHTAPQSDSSYPRPGQCKGCVHQGRV